MRKISLILFFSLLAISTFAQTNTFPTTGNVGIGTVTPNNKLEITGTGSGLRFTNLKSTTPYTSALTVNADGDVVLTQTSGLVNGIMFSDSRYNPTTPSDYNGALKANFKISSNVGLPAGSSIYSYIIGLRGWGDNSGGKAYELAFNDNSGLMMRSGFDEGWGQWRKLLVETENGRVGIGTSTPTEALEVAGNIKSHRGSFTGQTPGVNASHGSLEIREIGAVTTTQTSDDYAPRLILHWSGINSKSIALGRNGNIKFNDQNSSTAYAKIETGEILGFGRGSFTGQNAGANFSHGSLELREIGGVTTNQSSDDYAPRLTFHWAGRLSSSIAMGTSGNLKFNAQGSTTNFTGIEVGNIFSNGNVAINTATVPTGYKLAVKGNVIAEKLVVKTSTAWPDFVFTKDYKLPSLNEVEQFISKNSHLPEIPSAREVETNGHDVGEMNRLLLKKVEEITLYLIELKKENQEIKKENQEIKKVNDSLKTRIEKLEK
jgi:hypothetical protein